MQASGGDAGLTYSALDDRATLDALITSEGVIGLSSLEVTQRAAGADFSCDVSTGFCVILGDDVPLQGKYLCQNTAVVNLAIPTPPLSGSLIHRVIARVKDKTHNGSWSTYEWTLEVLADVGGGTPALPDTAITLALVTVAVGDPNVDDDSINNQRQVAEMRPTRPHVVFADDERPPNPRVGDRVHRGDRSPIEEVWDGTSWRMDASAARIYKDRSSDATGRTSTSLSADDVLTVTLIPQVTYRGVLVLKYTADAAGDFKWDLVLPTGGTIEGAAQGLPAASTGASGVVTLDAYTEASTSIGGGSGATAMTIEVEIKFWSGDGGTAAIHWCRDGATGTTVLKGGSWLDFIPVGT
jgi:hypothetical protein